MLIVTSPQHLLNALAYVQEQQWVGDGRGGQREAFVNRTVDPVRAMVAQPDDNDRIAAGATGADIDARIYLMPDTVAEVGDRIFVLGDVEGLWRIEAIVTDSRITLRRALCTRRQVQDG